MTQSEHQLLATILIMITVYFLEYFVPFSQERKFWEDRINKFFGL